MNEILKKRIDDAAQAIAPFNRMSQKRDFFVKGATFALQNQWISVEEALPKERELVFMRCKNNDIITFGVGVYEGTKDEWYEDGIGYVINVTHWTEIPSLKGGE